MSSEWVTTTIGELVRSGETVIQTGPFGSQLHRHDYVEAGISVIPTEAIGKGRILDIPLPKVSADKARELARHRLKAGDILFARRGAQATGLSAIIDHRYAGSLCGTGALLLRTSSSRILPHYLSVYLSSDFAFNWLRTHAVGAVMPNLNTGIIKALPLTLPPMSTQIMLSDFLNAIDDRIALLRDTNDTLEAIAQGLFKSWFVDFAPVRAKQEGREPEGMDADMAALFPDCLHESEVGSVPKGWVSGSFGSFLDESTKRVGQLESLVLSAVYSGELVKSSEHFTKKVHSEKINSYKAVLPFAFAYNPSRINIGSIGINEFNCQGAVSPVYVVATAKNPESAYYIWHHLRTNVVQGWIKTLCSGTVRQSLSFKDFASIPIVVPPISILKLFYSIREDLYASIQERKKQTLTLTEIRDTLLPRLILGELRLPEAEERASEVLTGT